MKIEEDNKDTQTLTSGVVGVNVGETLGSSVVGKGVGSDVVGVTVGETLGSSVVGEGEGSDVVGVTVGETLGSSVVGDGEGSSVAIRTSDGDMVGYNRFCNEWLVLLMRTLCNEREK